MGIMRVADAEKSKKPKLPKKRLIAKRKRKGKVKAK